MNIYSVSYIESMLSASTVFYADNANVTFTSKALKFVFSGTKKERFWVTWTVIGEFSFSKVVQTTTKMTKDDEDDDILI